MVPVRSPQKPGLGPRNGCEPLAGPVLVPGLLGGLELPTGTGRGWAGAAEGCGGRPDAYSLWARTRLASLGVLRTNTLHLKPRGRVSTWVSRLSMV